MHPDRICLVFKTVDKFGIASGVVIAVIRLFLLVCLKGARVYVISSKPSKTKDLKDSSIKMSYVEIYICRQGCYNLVSIAVGELKIVYDSFLDVYGAINPDDLEQKLVPQRWFGIFRGFPCDSDWFSLLSY